MDKLLLPTSVEIVSGNKPNSASVVITPCFHGYGTTLGNALRRVLLSSLPGSAVESYKIKGAQHEFSTVEGVQEDMTEIMLNLKQIIVRVFSEEPVTLTLSKKGPGVVTAGDFAENSNAEILNKDLVIAHLSGNKTFEMEITAGQGRGYKPVEEKDKSNLDLGTITIDSVYTPVKDVGYNVEFTRVGNITDFEKLSIEIETNGTISPEEAMRQATAIIMEHFQIVANALPEESVAVAEAPAPEKKSAKKKKEENN